MDDGRQRGGPRDRPPVDLGPLTAALRQQRARDVLGPDPVASHIAHSRGFATALGSVVPRRAVDLGSGGGVPGLVLAVACWPETEMALVDASQRRCTYLELVVGQLGLAPRVTVRWGRAEEIGREPAWRAGADVVVARSFGPPAAVAECAAPLLQTGGHLVVSDPPGEEDSRWPATGLALLGLELAAQVTGGDARYTVLRQAQPCGEDHPRRPGLPARRPLF